MTCSSTVFFRAGRLVFVLAGCTLAAAQTAQAPSPAAVTPASTAAAPADIVKPAPASAAPTNTAMPTLTLPQQIAALPRLVNPGIDTNAQGKAMLDHLNDVLRFYRESTTQAQKVGEPSDVLYSEQATAQATQIGQTAFQSARNLAALFDHLQPSGAPAPAATDAAPADENDGQTQEPTTAQRLVAVRTQLQARIADLSVHSLSAHAFQRASRHLSDFPRY